jgi:hypothetical protein
VAVSAKFRRRRSLFKTFKGVSLWGVATSMSPSFKAMTLPKKRSSFFKVIWSFTTAPKLAAKRRGLERRKRRIVRRK